MNTRKKPPFIDRTGERIHNIVFVRPDPGNRVKWIIKCVGCEKEKSTTVNCAQKYGWIKCGCHPIQRMIATGIKACSVCKKEKPRNQFSPRPRSPDGISCRCMACAVAAGFKRKFGVPHKHKIELLRAQDGRCANPGCRKVLTGTRLAVACQDHDHKSGNLRGVLCSGCNTALGLLAENRRTIFGLAEYIKQHQAA